jgi:formylglycine-generating enzyme required for sulfatase activity
MGAAPGDDTQQGVPRHPVTIRAFRLSETDVTFDQYDRFAHATGRPLPQDEGFGRGTRPVINIDRADMLAYLAWLGRASGEKGYRLPTEAEWEYAARAGTTTPYYWGNKPDPRYANTAGNKEPDHFPATSPVKSFLPNPYGLYDMAGNVWQEVQDCTHPDYRGAPSDGRAWMGKSCVSYITRGGCYGSITRGIKTTARAAVGASFRSMSVGFRVAQDARP